MARVTIQQDDKLGDIIIIEDLINNYFLVYRKNSPEIKIKEKTKEEAIIELKRINKRLREIE